MTDGDSVTARRKRGRPRDSDPAPSKDEILEAAIEVVCKVGLARASLDRVGKAAGASKTTVLYHFRSRDGLITALALRVMADFQEGVASGARMPPDDLKRAEAGIRSVFREPYRRSLLVVRELMSQGAYQPKIGELVHVSVESRVQMIAGLLDLPTPLAMSTARSLVMALLGCVDAWICEGREDPEPYREAALEATRALIAAARAEADG